MLVPLLVLLTASLQAFGLASGGPVAAAKPSGQAAVDPRAPEEQPAQAPSEGQIKQQTVALVRRYAAKTDAELTELSSTWQTLQPLERRVLLREVKMRMARQQGRQGVLRIRTERRFGRVVRQPDGSVVRLETRVVQVRKAPPSHGRSPQQTADVPLNQLPVRISGRVAAGANGLRQYGTGYSRRQNVRSAPQPAPPLAQPTAPQLTLPPAESTPPAANQP